MTLLQEREITRQARRLEIREQTRARLRDALTELIPGERVIVFGSLTRPGVFNDASDVDLALEREPAALSAGCLMVELSERLGRRVDIVMLSECRLRTKIEREGETWMT